MHRGTRTIIRTLAVMTAFAGCGDDASGVDAGGDSEVTRDAAVVVDGFSADSRTIDDASVPDAGAAEDAQADVPSRVDAGADAGAPAEFTRVCVGELSPATRSLFGVQETAEVELPDSFGTTHRVATAAEFRAAIAAASPGDLIAVADGTHAWGAVEVSSLEDGNVQHGGSGFEPEERVWIMPETPGGVTFRGARFNLYAQHLTFSDFTFDNAGFMLWAAPGTRITHSTFRGTNASIRMNADKGVSIDDVEIDNNHFSGMENDAIVWQTRPPGGVASGRYPTPQRMWIHHNRIENQGDGGRPCIGAGVGWNPFPDDQPAHTLIEYNSFDGCTGDDEVVEIKHRGVWLRYNLLENSGGGHYSGRMTSNAHYTGNIHMDGRGNGFRIFGSDNSGVFNLMNTRRSFTMSASEPSGGLRNLDYRYLASVDALYTKNIFLNSSVWMQIQDTGLPNESPSRGNIIRDNFWLGGGPHEYVDAQAATPYSMWLENNPEGAYPGDNWVMEDVGDGCFETAMSSVDFEPIVMEGEWTTEHRGESSADLVHRLPFWWFEVLRFEP